MADILSLSNRLSTLLIAKTPKAMSLFKTTFHDLNENAEGFIFILRSNDKARQIKKECIELGLTVEEN